MAGLQWVSLVIIPVMLLLVLAPELTSHWLEEPELLLRATRAGTRSHGSSNVNVPAKGRHERWTQRGEVTRQLLPGATRVPLADTATKSLPWSARDSQRRREVWDDAWRRLPQQKDWYQADSQFLRALLPRLPEGARVLELSAGRSRVAEGLARAGRARSVLSTDISGELVLERQAEARGRLDFEIADSLNLRFPADRRFDVVFEKAGVSDMQQANPRALQRLLACAATRALEPRIGGLLVALVHDHRCSEAARCSAGFVGAINARPEFNCIVEEFEPLIPATWLRPASSLQLVVARCRGTTERLARLGCDAA